MKRFFMAFVVWSLVLVIAQSADEMAFTFAPGDGTRFVETHTIKITKDFARMGVIKEKIDMATQYLYRRSAAGWTVEKTLTKIAKTVDGREERELFYSLLLDRKVVLNVATNAELISVTGFEDIQDAIRKSFSEDQQKMVLPVFTPVMMTEKEKTEWEGQTGSFAGRKVKVGEKWEEVAEQKTPNGVVKMYISGGFASVSTNKDGILVTLQYSSTSDAGAFRDMLNKGFSAMMGDESLNVGTIGYFEQGELTMELRTMLPRSRKVRRIMKFPFEVEGGEQILATRDEEHEFKYTIERPKP